MESNKELTKEFNKLYRTWSKGLQAKKKRYLKALLKSKGIVSSASKLCNLGKNNYYYWYKNDELFKEIADDIQENAIDEVETSFMKRVLEGDTTACIFYLKCKGKSRGYVEKQELDVNGTFEMVWEEPLKDYKPKDEKKDK